MEFVIFVEENNFHKCGVVWWMAGNIYGQDIRCAKALRGPRGDMSLDELLVVTRGTLLLITCTLRLFLYAILALHSLYYLPCLRFLPNKYITQIFNFFFKLGVIF